MDFLQGMSYLKQYWGVQAVIFGGVTAGSLLTGYVTEKTANHKDVDEKLGILQFRRRLPLYYTIGFFSSNWICWNVFSVYYWGGVPNSYLQNMVDFLASPIQTADIGALRLFLALGLFELHLLRRLYESMSVQVMSRKQVLNPIQKLLALLYYPLAVVSLVADAFPLKQHSPLLALGDLRIVDGVAVAVYLAASVTSTKTFGQFAKLRRNRFGHVTNTAYKNPKGSMFGLVCCPHYLAECVIYGSITAILGATTPGSTWFWLTGCVFASQAYLANNVHAWYKRKFEDFPSSTKRLIPFIF